jgi:hypothetical protein
VTREDRFREGLHALVEKYTAGGPDEPGKSRGLLVEELMLAAVLANPNGEPAKGVPLSVCLALQGLQAGYARGGQG